MLRAQARSSRDDVLDKARRKLAAGESVEDVLGFVADTLSNKILHAPSQVLRKADAVEQAMLLNTARKLFDLPDDEHYRRGRLCSAAQRAWVMAAYPTWFLSP